MSTQESPNPFEQVLVRYEQAFAVIEQRKEDSTENQIIELLVARDAVQRLLESSSEETGDHIARLNVVDKQLRASGELIAEQVNLAELRETLNRHTDFWWWHFTPPVDPWDKYDWVWQALTAGALALSASFMYNVYTAFAVGDADVATALSTIAQAAGLAVIGGGALTASGQAQVQAILKNLGIPPRFFAETTFAASLVLLAIVYATNFSLDGVFLGYGNWGYDDGNLKRAEVAFKQSLEINEDNIAAHRRLGEVHESLGELDEAFEQYLIASQEGEVDSLTSLGRVAINRKENPERGEADPDLAISYLLLGMQRAQSDPDTLARQFYQLRSNLGWAMLTQERYTDAIEYLENALDDLKQAEADLQPPDGGMAHCYLAYAYEQNQELDKAIETWKDCIQEAQPLYVYEYRWLITVERDDIAYCVNSKEIVGGYNQERRDAYCNDLNQVLADDGVIQKQ